VSKDLLAGDRVKMTDEAISMGLNSGNLRYPQTTTGLVVLDQDNDRVLIMRDGRRNPQSYHVKFWQIALQRSNQL